MDECKPLVPGARALLVSHVRDGVVGSDKYCLPRNMMPINLGHKGYTRKYCSPRHMMPINSGHCS